MSAIFNTPLTCHHRLFIQYYHCSSDIVNSPKQLRFLLRVGQQCFDHVVATLAPAKRCREFHPH